MKMSRFIKALRNRNGYVILAVLAVMLILLALSTNALVASYATVGEASKKKSDAQAYALATSGLQLIGKMVEAGEFSHFIQDQILDPAASQAPAEGATFTADTMAFIPLPDAPVNETSLSVHFVFSDVRHVRIVNTDGTEVTRANGLLSARVTTAYRDSQYSFLIDFIQLPKTGNPLESIWKIHSYRTGRSQLPDTNPEGGSIP